jgi:hypothetical protein
MATLSNELQETVEIYTAASQDCLMAAAEPIFGAHIITKLAHVLGRPVEVPTPCAGQQIPQTYPGFYLQRDGTTSRGSPLMCGGTAIHVNYSAHNDTATNCIIWIAGLDVGSIVVSRADASRERLVVDVFAISHAPEVVGLLLCAINQPVGGQEPVSSRAALQSWAHPVACLAPTSLVPSWSSGCNLVFSDHEKVHLDAGIVGLCKFLGCSRVVVIMADDHFRLQCYVKV